MSLDLDSPLVKFSQDKRDWWRIRDAFEGVQIFGGIGSGKTSGSGKTIAKSFLKKGFGGLVMCAKKGEAVEWLDYAIATNRWEDVIVFGKKNKFELWAAHLKKKKELAKLAVFNNRYKWTTGNDKRFNPLDYEMTREGEGAGEVFNLSHLFMELYKMGNRFSGGGDSGESERYWDTALKRCLNRIFQTLILAEEEISVNNMRKLLSTAPTEQDLENMKDMTDAEYLEWIEQESYCANCLNAIGLKVAEDHEEYGLVDEYFMRQFAKMPEKTRSTIEESFLGLAEPFLSGILKTFFSGETNLRPEITFEGKIIILDFSVKEYLQAGVYIFLTQNISNYYSQMGGEKAKSKVDSLLGNLSTKIFHANNDAVTNEWASNIIGKDLITLSSRSEQKKRLSVFADTTGTNESLSLLPQVLPKEFTILSSGGKVYDFTVQAIIQMKGREWSNGKNYNMVEFSQI